MNGSYDFIFNNSNETNATNWNMSNLEIEDEMELVPQDKLPPIVTIIAIVVGTIGNCLVCLAILLDRKLQNLTNYFLLSLAVADLLISLLILPGRLVVVRYKFQPSTVYLFYWYLIGDEFVIAASAIHICFISLERYFAIRNPFTQRTLPKKRVAIKIGLVWVIAFLTIIPYMTFAIINKNADQLMICTTLLSKFTYFDALVSLESFIIIVMIVVVTVAFILTNNILYKLAKKQEENAKMGNSGLVRTVGSKTNDDKSDNKKDFQVLESEKKALRVVWLVSFAFIICMAPYRCITLFHIAFPDIIIPLILLDIAGYFTYLNSLINPIIYTIFNKTFRDAFKNLILCKYKKHK